MRTESLMLFACSIFASFMLLTACQSSSYGKKVIGGVEVEEGIQYLPAHISDPRIVFVSDFELSSEDFQPEEGVKGALPGVIREHLPGRLGERLPHPLADQNPAAKAREIVDSLSEAIVQDLKDKGVEAARASVLQGGYSREGWIVRGVFTEVGEGNRLQRAVIGFGKGTTQMEAQIGVCDLASARPTEAFAVFGTVKDPSRIPGAVVTMNPYVAAAKFVVEKNATGRDVKKTAREIVSEILKIKAQVDERRR